MSNEQAAATGGPTRWELDRYRLASCGQRGGRANNVSSKRFQWASVPEQAPQRSRNRKSPLRRGGWADNGEGSGPGGRG